MGDKIEYSDLFSPDAFSKAIEGINGVKAAFEGLSNEFKQILVDQKQFQEGFKVKSYADIVKLNKSLDESTKTLKQFTEAQKAVVQSDIELAKLAQQKEKAQQQAIKTEIEYQKLQKVANEDKKRKISLYQQESKTLNDLRNKYKDLALSEKGASKEAQDLLSKITKLDAKLKNVDASVGQFQRNVGNYEGAFKSFAGSFQNILGAAGVTLGLGEIIQSVVKTRGEFEKFESVLTNTLGDKSEAQKSLSDIKDFAAKTPFSVAELTESFVKLANTGFKPTNKELKSLGDLASSQGKSFNQLTEAVIDAQTGEFERLKEFGIRAKKEGDKVTFTFKGQQQQVALTDEAIQKYIVSLGDATGVSGSMAAISETLEGKISNLGDQYDSFLNTVGEKTKPAIEAGIKGLSVLLEGLEGFLGGLGDLLSGNLASSQNVQDLQRIGNITEQTAKQIELAGFRLSNVYDKTDQKIAQNLNNIIVQTEGLAFTLEKSADKQKALQDIQKASINQLENLTKDYKSSKITQEEYSASVNLLSLRQNELNKVLTKQKIEKKEIVKIDEKAAKQAADDEKRLRKIIEDQADQAILTDQQREEALAKREFERKKKDIEDSKASQKTKNEALLSLELEYYNKRADIENKYIDEKEKREKEEKDKQKQLFDEALKAQDEALAKSDEEETKRLAEAKKKREDELKDLSDMAQKVLSIAEKEIKAKEKLREDALNKEIEDRENNIERQRELADKGLQNTLAFEEQRLAEAERRKEDEAKKSLKREKTLAFFKLFAANAEKDPNTALQKTIVETLLADAVAGAFFKGTEKVSDDLKGNKVHNGRDGYVVAVDGSERVMTGEQNKKVGAMSNEELAQLAHDYQKGLLPKYAITDSMNVVGTAKNIVDSAQLHQLVNLNKGIEGLEETIKNKKEVILAIDNFGNVLRTEIENGLKRVEMIKRNRPRI